jgi:hypothetical protein
MTSKLPYILTMKNTVFIESTIPSYYYETRKTAQAITWRDATRKWWKEYKHYYQVVSSAFVIRELEEGTHPRQKDKIDLVKNGVELLAYVPAIKDIAELYIKNQLMPAEEIGDAFHLAFASYYNVDFLLTWNCAHLANPNKYRHIEFINKTLGLETPYLCTPIELLEPGR